MTEMKTAKTILVVDDDEAHLMIAREILEAEGYSVETHHGAFGATETALALRPDLVLLDVNMPGLSGDRLAGVLQTQRAARACQVLLWSSNDEDTLQRAVKRLAVGGFVCKGDPAALREGVRSLVG